MLEEKDDALSPADAAAVDAVIAGLPPDWLGHALALRLLTRALWERLYFATFADSGAKSRWAWEARDLWQARSRYVPDLDRSFDPHMSDTFRRFLIGTDDLP